MSIYGSSTVFSIEDKGVKPFYIPYRYISSYRIITEKLGERYGEGSFIEKIDSASKEVIALPNGSHVNGCDINVSVAKPSLNRPLHFNNTLNNNSKWQVYHNAGLSGQITFFL